MADVERKTDRRLRVLFVMRRLKYLPYHRQVLELIVERGHHLQLLLQDADHSAREQAWLEEMTRRPNFSYVIENHFTGDPFRKPAMLVRRGSEYLRTFPADYATREARHKQKTFASTPAWLRSLERRGVLKLAPARAAARRLLLGLERVMPLPRKPWEFVRTSGADVVLVSDHGRPGSLYSAYVQAAHESGIPVALCVASWDNLSTRQVTRVQPDRVIVWNDHQVREAVSLHALPAESVITTGAPTFDDWFSRTPRDPGEFKTRAGLDPLRPYLLWVGGALLPAAKTEAEYAVEWLEELRGSGDPVLETIGVMLRPHPLRLEEWLAADFSGFENVVVYPGPGMTMPVGDDQRADYFDSVYHCEAVVGVNSSAMIEAAVIGRPVLAVLVPEFSDSQEGTFHFSYLLEENGGPVRLGRTPAGHLEQLRKILDRDDAGLRAQAAAFVAAFVRPHGLDRPVTPMYVDAIEQVAALETPAWAEPRHIRASSAILAAMLKVRPFLRYQRKRVLDLKNVWFAR